MTVTSETEVPLRHADRFFIDGQWVAPSSGATFDVIDSSTEQVYFQVPEAQAADMDRAVTAARRSALSSISAFLGAARCPSMRKATSISPIHSISAFERSRRTASSTPSLATASPTKTPAMAAQPFTPRSITPTAWPSSSLTISPDQFVDDRQ